jgi:hypothetical protein
MAKVMSYSAEELSAFEWANFAKRCGLTQRLVTNELARLARQTLKALAEVEHEVLTAGALPAPVCTSCEVIRMQTRTQGAMAIKYEK